LSPPLDPVAVTERARRALLGGLAAYNLLVPATLFVLGWPTPWRIFEGEASPINWFSSVQCALVGGLALLVGFVTRLGQAAGTDAAPRAWTWTVLGLGLLFLAADEGLEIHENVREVWLKPRGVLTEVPGLKPGDVVLLAYVVAGLFLAWLLYRDLQRERGSLVLFAAALLLIAVDALQDSLSFAVLEISYVRHVQLVAEETGELWAQGLFGASFVLLACAKLRALLAAGPRRQGA
jgi:hypothetical protein